MGEPAMSAQWDFTVFRWRGAEDAIREFSYDDYDWYDDEYEYRGSHHALSAIPVTDERGCLGVDAPVILMVLHEETETPFLVILRSRR
jgi:hypothetical protein